MAYITCEDLALGYEGKAVTEHIHFTVNKGDYLCIIGENGAGKSTLMKTLLRLIQPISGTIETGDGLSAYEVGYLPQQTAVQKDFPASVMEIVLTGTLNKSGWKPFYSRQQKNEAQQAKYGNGFSTYNRANLTNPAGLAKFTGLHSSFSRPTSLGQSRSPETRNHSHRVPGPATPHTEARLARRCSS